MKGDLCLSRYHLPAIALHLIEQNLNVYLLVIGNIQSFTSQFFIWSVPWEKTSIFFSLLEFDIERNSDHENPKIKLYTMRPLKCYLNEQNLINV